MTRTRLAHHGRHGQRKRFRLLHLHSELLEDRRMLAVQDLSSFPSEFVAFDSDVVFAAQDQDGYELWKYDGSSVTQIDDLNVGGSSYPDELTVVGSHLYFTATDDGQRIRLWKYDGVSVSAVVDGTGSAPYGVFDMIDVGGSLFFVADDGTHGPELWTSDGTPAGTFMLRDIFPDDVALDGPQELTDVNGTLYFTAYDDQSGWELWTSDGTTAGTQIVADLLPNEEGSAPQDLAAVGNTLFFHADDGVDGRELWKKVGAAAPELVKDITVEGDSDLADFVPVGSQLYFSAWDEVAGTAELWSSDGTAAGTQPILPLRPGESWDIARMEDVNGTLMFSLRAHR